MRGHSGRGRWRVLRWPLAGLTGAGAAVLLVSSPVAGQPPQAAKATILYPAVHDTAVCAGTVQLLGETSADPSSARWQYAPGGSVFRPVHGKELRSDNVGPDFSQVFWDTSSLPTGAVHLRLRFGDGPSASSTFLLDQPPTLEKPAASENFGTGMTTLSVRSATATASAEARAAQKSKDEITWYLGDGTTETGNPVTHRFTPGDYVITVQVRDPKGCTTRKVVLLHVSSDAPPTLSAVDWCDPLDGELQHHGTSHFKWPPDVGTDQQSTKPPENVPLARRHDAGAPGFAAAFGFEVRFQVLGDPAKCTTGQVVRSKHWETENGKNLEIIAPGSGPEFASDGYDRGYTGRFYTVQPAADGTSTIAWLDFPGVPYSTGGVTAAQVTATLVSYVSGQEAPISHKETEGPGETVFFRFRVCAAWNEPAGTVPESFRLLGAGGPDARQPAETEPPLAESKNVYPDSEHWGPAKTAMPGCGPKNP